MNYQEQVYTQITPDPAKIEFESEKRDLRKRCNSIGLITILSSVVFLTISVILVFIQMIIGFTSGEGLAENINSIPDNILGGLSNLLGIGIIGFCLINSRKKFTDEPLPFDKIKNNILVPVICIGFTVCMISNLLTNTYISALYSIGIDINLDFTTQVSNSPLEVIVEILAVAAVPAFSEEILFRGILLSTLRKYGDGFAVFVSSFIFGLFHGNLIQFPFAFVVGLVLGWTLVYTNSLLPAIMIHFLNNCFSVVLDIIYSNSESLNLNESSIDILTSIFVGIIAIISIILAYKLSKTDKSFLKLKSYEGVLDNGTKIKTLVTSPAIIVSVILLIQETLLTHLSENVAT